MSRIQINVDELEEFADQLGKAERDCTQALNAVTWHFNSLLADFPGVLPCGIHDLEAEFKQAIRQYRDKLDDAQRLIKMTAAEMEKADQKMAGAIGGFLLEMVGWYDLQRVYSEYDPVTGEKLSAGDRALAIGMLALSLFPPGKAVGVGGKAAVKGINAGIEAASKSGLPALAKNSKAFMAMKNVVNPNKVSEAFRVVYNRVVQGPLAATKVWFDQVMKKLGDLPVPANLQVQLAGVGPMRTTVRESLEGAKESVVRMVNDGKSDNVINVVNKSTDVSKNPKYYTTEGEIIWPPNRGFIGEIQDITLEPGTRIDRYGYEGGTFVSPVGTPYEMRALAPGTNQKPYNVYEVVKPVNVQSGRIAPWFDEPGLGIQHEFNKSIKELIEEGTLRRVEK
ncbi:hypothetical protein CU633_12615 [Bacillus sp. V3-13]|uniref:glycohydrolase toxin TNT-related protein n=1 Tax=Bacillus sp. V3-13 TaxID=2053728 RepID=UPI000C76327C|nr:glycohydrolase toxin TNT-related protein [Bacillus sp. V3-13]PLR77051.1 hypothetical protein CU633_12615 [Bacillus sp. V3-13]